MMDSEPQQLRSSQVKGASAITTRSRSQSNRWIQAQVAAGIKIDDGDLLARSWPSALSSSGSGQGARLVGKGWADKLFNLQHPVYQW